MQVTVKRSCPSEWEIHSYVHCLTHNYVDIFLLIMGWISCFNKQMKERHFWECAEWIWSQMFLWIKSAIRCLRKLTLQASQHSFIFSNPFILVRGTGPHSTDPGHEAELNPDETPVHCRLDDMLVFKRRLCLIWGHCAIIHANIDWVRLQKKKLHGLEY